MTNQEMVLVWMWLNARKNPSSWGTVASQLYREVVRDHSAHHVTEEDYYTLYKLARQHEEDYWANHAINSNLEIYATIIVVTVVMAIVIFF